MQIKVNIKARMAQAGIRGRHLAPLLNITEPNVSLLINGKSKSISYKQMATLCRILSCQPNDLFEIVQSTAAHPCSKEVIKNGSQI